MTTYFITRHLGSVAWANANQIHYDKHLTHLDDVACLKSGDTVIGTLSVNLIYAINQAGVRYVHLSLDIPAHLRGVELGDDELAICKATLEEFVVIKK